MFIKNITKQILRNYVQPSKLLPNQLTRCASSSSTSAENNGEVKVDKLIDDLNGITVIGLNRPSALNAFSLSLVSELGRIVHDISFDKDVRVVIIRSLVANAFSAGADLKERSKMSHLEVRKVLAALRNLFIAVEQLPMPVIAALDGTALGGGLELALACDLRTATDDIKMGLVETKLAIIPGAGGSQRLPRLINPAIAKELIYTARIFSGKVAEKLGIVNYSLPQNANKDNAYQKALEIAKEILPNGPVGVRMAKRAISSGIQVDISSGFVIEESCYAQLLQTKDRVEGIQAFIEKRKPLYTGE